MIAKIGKILLVGLGLVIMYRVFGTLVPGLAESYREEWSVNRVFDQYTTALVGKHYEAAYAICGYDLRQVTSYDNFVGIYKSLEEQYGPLKSVKRSFTGAFGRGTPILWKAAIDADFLYSKRTLRFEFGAHKEGDRWVLSGFEQR
jgi:hypothetical protein